MDNKEIGLWTPLIGFDVTKEDKGAKEYLDNATVKPSCVGLFVYNCDIINYHQAGMPKEIKFPKDYCNYYGSPQNDLRKRQDWTNYDLRTLASELKNNGVESYMSVMGNHLSPPDDNDFTPQVGMFGYECVLNFVMQHRELAIESTKERGYIHLLKRFKDGSYFGDYFIKKAFEAIKDYNMTGLHLADAIFPHSIQAQWGDFSDDMIEQFAQATGIRLPKEITLPLKSKLSPGISARADFIWNKHRVEWLTFLAKSWEKFFTKLCKVFHEGGKKVMVNNAWTAEPFEAFYRFGVDYKGLERAGVDVICIEDQAAILYMNDEGSKYRIHELMNVPMVMKAYAPGMKYLSINYAKDSTEEGSIINHNPPANEREIYMLTSPLYKDKNGVSRVVDGLFVCLADSLSKEEWKWLDKRYSIAYRNKPLSTLSATLVWSDGMMTDFTDKYVATKRYSTHKIVAELSRYGGKVGCVARIENLNSVSGLILVPNIDTLTAQEIEAVSNYNGGVIFTSISNKLPKLPKCDIYFEDNTEVRSEYRMCAGGFNLGYFNYAEVTKCLSEEEVVVKLSGESRYIEDSPIWLIDFVYREVSKGFLKAVARLVFTTSQNIVRAGNDDLLTIYKMDNGMLRLIIENDSVNHYKSVFVHIKNRNICKIVNANDFPVQPLKLLYEGDEIKPNIRGDEQLKFAKGFIAKLSPSGCAFVDLKLTEIEE